MYKNHYKNDPYWMTARFTSPCHKCKCEIKKGEQAYYYPNGKYIFCKTCGEACYHDFMSHAMGEEGMCY